MVRPIDQSDGSRSPNSGELETVSPSRELKPVLAARSLSKRYGANVALDDVDFYVEAGEVVGLVGANGAGKSTLIKALSGAISPDSGEITVGEWSGSSLSPRSAHELGVVTIYQDPSVAPTLGLVENVVLGRESSRGRVFLNSRRDRQQAIACLKRVGLDDGGGMSAGSLSSAGQQLLEIAKALYREPRVVFMDEPTSALGDVEAQRLAEVIADLERRGVAVVYISHRLEEVLQLCRRVVVMRDGRVVRETDTALVTAPDLVRSMIGHDVKAVKGHVSARGEPALVLKDVTQGSRLRNVSLSLSRGEVLGVTGLVGSGRSRLGRVIYGVEPPDGGIMTLFGEPYSPRSPATAVGRGVGFIPEDRKRDALLMHQSAAKNVTLARLVRGALGRLRIRRERDVVRRWIEQLDIDPPVLSITPAQMSGGNQQKLVIARWIHADSRVLIIDEPGQGIDVGAKDRVLAAIRALADEGKAVLLISQEVEELQQIADRTLVMRRGEVVGELDRPELTEAAVVALSMDTHASAGRVL